MVQMVIIGYRWSQFLHFDWIIVGVTGYRWLYSYSGVHWDGSSGIFPHFYCCPLASWELRTEQETLDRWQEGGRGA